MSQNIDVTVEFLKEYKNCLVYCGIFDFDDEEEINECITEINNDKKYNSNDNLKLCQKKNKKECKIIKDKRFKKLLNYLINFMQILYSIRSKYSNKYDNKIILLLGYLNLKKEFNIDLNELECVNFPGDNTSQLGFPNNLKNYFEIMKLNLKIELIKYDNLIELNDYEKTIIEKYSKFMNDFQPWSRTINTFLNIYSDKKIPPIENISNYGDFIKNKNIHLREFDLIKESFLILFLDRINNYLKVRLLKNKKNKSIDDTNKNLLRTLLYNNPKNINKSINKTKNKNTKKNVNKKLLKNNTGIKNRNFIKTRKKLLI
tara:strand:+ start:170 stop:1117 length:948 start_codon:yes stop_codon:yes gene_type:complete